MLRQIHAMVRDNRGVTSLEYALIAGLIFAAVIGATAALAPKLTSSFKNIGTTLVLRDAGT